MVGFWGRDEAGRFVLVQLVVRSSRSDVQRPWKDLHRCRFVGSRTRPVRLLLSVSVSVRDGSVDRPVEERRRGRSLALKLLLSLSERRAGGRGPCSRRDEWD